MKLLKDTSRFFTLFTVLLFVLLMISFLNLRYKQYIYYQKAVQYEKTDRPIEAVDNYVMVVYMHTPLSDKERKSIESLIEIAKKFKEDNETLKALYVYERLRSAIYGTRWLTTPHKEILNKIEEKIINIRAEMLKKDGYKKSIDDTKKELEHIMKTDLAPNPFLALIGVVAFLLFVGSVIFLIIFSVKENQIIWKRFVSGLSLVVVFWIIWLAMMYLA